MRKFGKIFAILLTLCVLVAAVTIVASATEPVTGKYIVDGTGYDDWAEAEAAVATALAAGKPGTITFSEEVLKTTTAGADEQLGTADDVVVDNYFVVEGNGYAALDVAAKYAAGKTIYLAQNVTLNSPDGNTGGNSWYVNHVSAGHYLDTASSSLTGAGPRGYCLANNYAVAADVKINLNGKTLTQGDCRELFQVRNSRVLTFEGTGTIDDVRALARVISGTVKVNAKGGSIDINYANDSRVALFELRGTSAPLEFSGEINIQPSQRGTVIFGFVASANGVNFNNAKFTVKPPTLETPVVTSKNYSPANEMFHVSSGATGVTTINVTNSTLQMDFGRILSVHGTGKSVDISSYVNTENYTVVPGAAAPAMETATTVFTATDSKLIAKHVDSSAIKGTQLNAAIMAISTAAVKADFTRCELSGGGEVFSGSSSVGCGATTAAANQLTFTDCKFVEYTYNPATHTPANGVDGYLFARGLNVKWVGGEINCPVRIAAGTTPYVALGDSGAFVGVLFKDVDFSQVLTPGKLIENGNNIYTFESTKAAIVTWKVAGQDDVVNYYSPKFNQTLVIPALDSAVESYEEFYLLKMDWKADELAAASTTVAGNYVVNAASGQKGGYIDDIKINLTLYSNFRMNLYISTGVTNVSVSTDIDGENTLTRYTEDDVKYWSIGGKTYTMWTVEFGVADVNSLNFYINYTYGGEELQYKISYSVPQYANTVYNATNATDAAKYLVANLANYATNVLTLGGVDTTEGNAKIYADLAASATTDSYLEYYDALVADTSLFEDGGDIYTAEAANLAAWTGTKVTGMNVFFSTTAPAFVVKTGEAVENVTFKFGDATEVAAVVDNSNTDYNAKLVDTAKTFRVSDMADKLTVVVDGETYEYSLAQYICGLVDGGAAEADVNAALALYAYAKYADAYLNGTIVEMPY